MIIVGILFIIGIIVRWDHVSREVADAFSGLFRKPQQEQVGQPVKNIVNDEDTDN